MLSYYEIAVLANVLKVFRNGRYTMNKFLSLLLFCVLLLASGLAYAEPTEIDRVIAVVGDEVVTLSELQTEMAPGLERINQTLRGEDQAQAADKLRRATLDSLIDKYLQLQEAKIQGIEVAGPEVDAAIEDIMTRNKMDKAAFAEALQKEGYTVEDYRKNLSDQLKIMRLVTRAVKSRISVSEDEVALEYDKNKAVYTQDESVKVAHIFFPAPAGNMDEALKNAREAREKIMSGVPFEEMAAKCSGDESASKTCVLGTFSKGQLSKAVEEQAFKMAAGEVSEPMKMENGYRLIKVMERTSGGVKTLKDVRTQIVEELSAKKGEELFAKWVQDLRKHTYVEIRD